MGYEVDTASCRQLAVARGVEAALCKILGICGRDIPAVQGRRQSSGG